MTTWAVILGVSGVLVGTWGLGYIAGERHERKAQAKSANYVANVRRASMHTAGTGRRA